MCYKRFDTRLSFNNDIEMNEVCSGTLQAKGMPCRLHEHRLWQVSKNALMFFLI